MNGTNYLPCRFNWILHVNIRCYLNNSHEVHHNVSLPASVKDYVNLNSPYWNELVDSNYWDELLDSEYWDELLTFHYSDQLSKYFWSIYCSLIVPSTNNSLSHHLMIWMAKGLLGYSKCGIRFAVYSVPRKWISNILSGNLSKCTPPSTI